MFTELILVPGHAVWNLRDDPECDSSWFLKPFQNGEPKYFIEHIRAGVEVAAQRQNSLLMFSGAATDAAAGPLTEALGYWMIADWYRWWNQPGVRGRAVLEEHALDSFQNVLFGLHRFRELAGDWPQRVTVCGWGFKQRRIAELHRQALGWTRPFDYVAVNDPPELSEASRREEITCAEFEADPWGERPPIAEKRRSRASLGRVVHYDLSAVGWA